MKNSLFIWLFGLLLIGAACGGGNSQATDSQETTDETTTESTSEAMESGENYQITVVDAEPASPRKEMKGTIGGATITINYGSPSVKGRQLFGKGGLEPYNEVWRTGANAATSIEVSQPITVGGQNLPAGKYGLFTIPGENEWTIIFNSNYDMWGDGDYNQAQDVLRVTVQPETLETPRETMDFVMEGNKLILKWGNIAVPVEITAS